MDPGRFAREVRAAAERPVRASLAAAIREAAQDPTRVQRHVAEVGGWIVTPFDDAFPDALRRIEPQPPVLFGMGERSVLGREPHVAVVTKNAERKGTLPVAKAYLESLYTPEAQEIIANSFYRPIDPDVLAKHRSTFPDLKLFKITAVAKSWDDAIAKFFGDGGLFDSFYKPK